MRIIFSEYSVTRAQDQVKVFVSSKLERFPNPTYGNIVRLTQEFNAVWAQTFRTATTTQQRQSLESINVNRNAIAHGGVSGVTVGQLANYHADIVQMIETLETTCI